MKTVLITGASRGIGRAAARLFCEQGWQVWAGYLHAEKEAASLLAEYAHTNRMHIVKADISLPEEAARLVATPPRIDVLINNAGIALEGLVTDTTPAQWRAVMAANLDAVFYTTRAALPGMVARKRGCIINVSSIWGITGASCEAAYSAAKAGVIGYTKALAKEVGPSGITANCIAPGVIETDMLAGLSSEDLATLCGETPLGRLGSPKEIASLMLYLASDAASFITGQVISPNGGMVI